MSRVGKKPIQIIKGVKVSVNGNTVLVEGPKGKLTQDFLPSMKIEVNGEQVIVTPKEGENVKNAGAIHGLTRSLITIW